MNGQKFTGGFRCSLVTYKATKTWGMPVTFLRSPSRKNLEAGKTPEAGMPSFLPVPSAGASLPTEATCPPSQGLKLGMPIGGLRNPGARGRTRTDEEAVKQKVLQAPLWTLLEVKACLLQWLLDLVT